MVEIVAGHSFRSLTPGEFCTGVNCEGIRSLVELCCLDGSLKQGDRQVAHVGTLTDREVVEIHDAAVKVRERMENVMGFRKG